MARRRLLLDGTTLITIIILLVVSCSQQRPIAVAAPQTAKPSASVRQSATDDRTGSPVTSLDWLEHSDDSRVREWVGKQNEKTNAYLNALPSAESFFREMLPLYRMRGPTRPKVSGTYWYYLDYGTSKERHALKRQDLATRREESLLELSGELVSEFRGIDDYWPSYDNRWLAVTLDKDGSDVKELVLFELGTPAKLVRRVGPVHDPGLTWAADSSGFFFRDSEDVRRVTPAERVAQAKVVRRSVSNQHENRQILRPGPGSPEVWEWPITSPTSSWLALERDLASSETEILARPTTLEGTWRLVAKSHAEVQTRLDGDSLYALITDTSGEPNLEVFDLKHPGQPPRVLWRRDGKRILLSFELMRDAIALRLLVDAKHTIQLLPRASGRQPRSVESTLAPGSIEGPVADVRENVAVYAFTSMKQPRSYYALSASQEPRPLWSAPDFDGSDLVLEQFFADADDGIRVPYFLLRQAAPRDDRPRPTMMYGYGGHGQVVASEFLASPVAWVRHGGVYVVANIRGGGEYGDAWHLAGARRNKPRAFADYLSVAEDVIRRGWAAPGTLVARGSSHAALTAAASVIARPELFGALICRVPIADMLRYDRLGVGKTWITEFGDPADPNDRRVLESYSPVHRVRQGTRYPPALIVAGARDDRVHPAHAQKLAAALQASGTGGPFLLRTEDEQGHGGPGALTLIVRQDAQLLAFAWENLRTP